MFWGVELFIWSKTATITSVLSSSAFAPPIVMQEYFPESAGRASEICKKRKVKIFADGQQSYHNFGDLSVAKLLDKYGNPGIFLGN